MGKHVETINKLLVAQETAKVGNDWKIGRSLSWIRTRVTDGTWTRVCTEQVQGIAGRVLGMSSLQKKMKLYNTFPKNEKKAIAIGVGRLDVICKLPLVEEREAVVNEGIKFKGKVHQVESMKVRDLAACIDAYLEKKHKKAPKTPTAALHRQVQEPVWAAPEAPR